MIIRCLKQSDSERVTLVLDNGEEIPSTLGVVTELRLFAGKTVEDAQLALLREKTACALAREHALMLLAERLRRSAHQSRAFPARNKAGAVG